MLLLGIVGAAGEYRHRTVAPAALVTGRDAGQMLLARAGAYASRAWASPRWPRSSRSRSACRCWRASPVRRWAPATSRSSPAGACSPRRCRAILGVALGALVRNQVVAVTGTLVVLFVVLPLVQAMSGTALDLTPFAAAQGVAGSTMETLSRGEAGLVLVGWTLAALIAAIVAERRRDIA